MKYRILGKTGYKVSEIGFGAWQIGGTQWGDQKDEESIAALNLAIDKGVNFIDTAAVYGHGRSEKIIAGVLKERQEKVYVSTKIPFCSPFHPEPYDSYDDVFPEKYLIENTNERLRMLSTDKIDILLLHSWSRAWNDDPRPLEVLHKLKDKGLVENVGISAPPFDQNNVVELIKKDMLDVVEVIFNIFNQEAAAEIIPAAIKHNVGIIVRVPLEEGALTGKYNKNTRFEKNDFRYNYFGGDRLERTLERVERLKEDITDTDLSLIEASLLFILAQKAVGTVIPGMRKPSYVEDNTRVSDMEPLSEKLIEKLKKHNWVRTSWIYE